MRAFPCRLGVSILWRFAWRHAESSREIIRSPAKPLTAIDLHSHVLPGIDDGPETLQESVALAAGAAADGTRVLAATPHLRADHPGLKLEELPERCASLSRAVADAGERLDLVPGAEVDLAWACAATDKERHLATYGQWGRDVLVETPYGWLPDQFEQQLFGALRRLALASCWHTPSETPPFSAARGVSPTWSSAGCWCR